MHASDAQDTFPHALPREALESSVFGVFVLDPRFHVVWVNRAMESYFGIKREEVIGKSKRAIIRSRIKYIFEDPGRFEATVLATYDRNTYVERFQCHVLPRHGREERWLEHHSRPIETGDLAGGRIEHYYDITEMVRSRERLRNAAANKKLESLSVLAGGIAHDFNNLLMGIMGCAEMALADLPAESPVREEIELAMEAARKAADLSKLMLAYSGKGRFVTEPVDLRLVVSDAMGHEAPSAGASGPITVRRRFSDDVPTVSADPGQLRDLLCNLLVNAREAISAGGTITVSVDGMECSEEDLAGNRSGQALRPGQYVCLSVSDTGCGMSEETLDKLFDPFYSTKFVGRGLGLSAVLGMVRAHGAGIFVESEEGRGSTIRVLFPADAPAESEAHVAETGGGECVLLVDDEKQVRAGC